MNDALLLDADVLVIGSGAAGMMAARAASDVGASVIIADKSLIGRGGATILAQMTVAVALGAAEPDSPELHAADTLEGSRGLADPEIVRAITERGPEVILEAERYGTKWARVADGSYSQVHAPGHSRKRCVYVDVLRTGDGVSTALRSAIWRDPNITRLSNVMITQLLADDGTVIGAAGFALEALRPVGISASTVIIAAGGMTQVYARNSASANMTGDGLMLAAAIGARLSNPEMVQFFPIAHLYPPLVHLDPIMWDPFRYKLGGRLLNGEGNEFMDRYNGEVGGRYTAPRDVATWAIFQEVKAGRGSPHGGVYLDFKDVDPQRIAREFGGVVKILADQGIDLARDTVEVSPTAHFYLSGIEVDAAMQTTVDGLLACGEAIDGMHGANRLSGNAITEALVTGRIAGETAAARPRTARAPIARAVESEWARLQAFWHPRAVGHDEIRLARLKARLQHVMWTGAGPLREEAGLQSALADVRAVRAEAGDVALARTTVFPLSLQEKVELRTMIDVSEAVILGALARTETRGAHVRLDYPETDASPVRRSFTYDGGAWTSEVAAPVIPA